MTSKLEQRHGLFHRRTYEIIDKEILITSRTLSSGETTKYQIFDLSDTTVREFKREWGWIVLALLSFVPSISFISDAINLKVSYPLVPAAGFWLVSVAFVLLYLNKSYDKIIFKRWQNDSGLFVIWNNKPNKEKFDAFYEKLMEEIKKTKVNPKLSSEQKLELYANHLQFLADEDVISGEEAEEIYSRKKKAMDKERSKILGIVPNQA